jgi:hypothetical protein
MLLKISYWRVHESIPQASNYLVGSRGIFLILIAVIIYLKCLELGYCNSSSFVSVTLHKEELWCLFCPVCWQYTVKGKGFLEVKASRFRVIGTWRWQVISHTHRPSLPQEYPGTHFKKPSRPCAHGIIRRHGRKSPLTPLVSIPELSD